jgi:hypothetical protein
MGREREKDKKMKSEYENVLVKFERKNHSEDLGAGGRAIKAG